MVSDALYPHNVLEACPRSLQRKLPARLRHLFDAPDWETARRILELVVQEFEGLAPKRWRGLRSVLRTRWR